MVKIEILVDDGEDAAAVHEAIILMLLDTGIEGKPYGVTVGPIMPLEAANDHPAS